MKPDPQTLDKLVQQIVSIAHPVRIILFGSAARGEMGAESDLDILVVMPEGTPRRKTAQELYYRISGVSIPCDILVATPSILEKYKDDPGFIFHNILVEGEDIYAA
jgi:predicted nucleotidyltransferase